MKTFIKSLIFGILFMIPIFALVANAEEHSHEHHAKHNMVLYGDSQLYLSHLVYKVPHNYQVILAVKLHPDGKVGYEISKALHPEAQHIFQLDEIDISKINTEKMNLTGTLSRLDAEGKKTVLATEIPITEYSVVYFNELPLSLAKD